MTTKLETNETSDKLYKPNIGIYISLAKHKKVCDKKLQKMINKSIPLVAGDWTY